MEVFGPKFYTNDGSWGLIPSCFGYLDPQAYAGRWLERVSSQLRSMFLTSQEDMILYQDFPRGHNRVYLKKIYIYIYIYNPNVAPGLS